MTLLDIPPISTTVYHDGTPVILGGIAVPVLLIVDASNKLAMVKGSPITVRDLNAPVLAGVSAAQAASGYAFAPAAGTVADFTSGAVKVYHVIVLSGTPAMSAAQLAALVAASAPGDFGEATVSQNVPGQQVALSGLASLTASRVYAGAGSGFRAIREGDTVVSYVLAVDDSQLKSAASAPALAVDDRTPPSGLSLVTLGAPAATTIPVQNLDKITDGGDGVQSISLFYGTSGTFASASPVPGNPIPPTASYNIAGLDDATVYNVWVSATDGTNAVGPVSLGSARTLDATDPVISAFDVAQDAGSAYTFTATAGTVVDNAAGPLKAYLVMCASPQTTEQLEAIGKAAVQASAKNEAFTYAANAAASVSAMSLSTSQFWTGSAFASISEAAPAAPHQLWAHLLVVDAAGNAGSSQNAGAIKTVADRTAPVFTGTLQAGATTATAAQLSWSGVSDGRDGTPDLIIGAYTAASSITAANLEAGTGSGFVSKVTVPDGAGTRTTSYAGLTGTTSYHFYAVAKDASGNYSAVRSLGPVLTADDTAPTGGAVTVSAATFDGFTASWSGFADNVAIAAYEVFTNTTNAFAGATKFGQDLGPSASSVVVTGLESITDYYAIVRAKDAAGNASAAVLSPLISTTSATFSSTHADYDYTGPGIYIRHSNVISDWVTQGIPLARTPISMYIGTTKVLHAVSKKGFGIPAVFLTVNNNVVVDGVTYVVGNFIRSINQFSDNVSIFSVTPLDSGTGSA